MTRSAWIIPFLSPTDRATFVRAIGSIVPGAPERVVRFVVAAEEAVDTFRKLTLPAQRELEMQQDKLRRVADAGNAFAAAVAGLDDDSRGLIQQAQRFVVGDATFPEIEQTTSAADWAQITAKAAERLLARKPKTKSPGRKLPPAVATLVGDLARAYASVFDERPSAAREGRFAKVLAEVLGQCNVYDPGDSSPKLEIGESRLNTILKSQYVPAPLK